MKRIIFFLLPFSLIYACDFIEPRPLTDQTSDELWSHATYGEGILTQGYAQLQNWYPLGWNI